MEKEVSKLVQDHAEKEVSKEVIPSNTFILKCTKKPTKRPQHSPVRQSILEVEVEIPTKSQHTHSYYKGVKKIRKPLFN